MKNPPIPDSNPAKPGQPADHNPTGETLPVDPSEQGKLEPMDDAYLHGGKSKDRTRNGI